MPLHRTILVFLSLHLALPACSKDKDDGPLDCGDEKTARSPIINGTAVWDPSVITITEAQARAVGFLNLGGRAACTGTLVASRTVLTAAHCVRGVPYIQFVVGEDYRSPAGIYDAASYVSHPYYSGSPDFDIGVVTLVQDPMDDGVQPIPVNLEPVQTLAGEDVVAVGFGITRPDTGGNSRKWWTVLSVVMESPTVYTTNGDGVTGPCQGDSGGPLLWTHPELGTRVYAPVSSVESYECVGLAFYPRTDFVDSAAFIRSYLPIDPCDGETFEGRCEGNTAIWCDGASVSTDVCDSWETCQLDSEGHYRCVATDPCRGETYEGRCDDAGAAVWCEDENIYVHGCPDFGYWCGMNDDGLYRCLPPGPCEAEGLDWNGTCTADGHVRWCEDGQVRDRDCWLCDQDCGWAGDHLGNYCLDRE